MRDELCQALVARADREGMIFLTGDLGFMALEPLERRLGARFINCGVAEQNMVTVAAALASEGLEPWVYSIAPFCYARPFEQIRNDVCFHGLAVRLVGNGGGYAYGVMGPTHHAIEDYGVLLTLPELRVYIPAFSEDVSPVVERMGEMGGPSYLRLGRSELPKGMTAPAYAPWRKLRAGAGPLLIALGPLGGLALATLQDDAEHDPEIWVTTELPIEASPPPAELVARLSGGSPVCVYEEHVAHGGLGAMLALWAARQGMPMTRLRHLHARGYPSGRYGSQAYLRHHSGLGADDLRRSIAELAAR
ncbi:transketolase family protein [Plastoroseomonas hellenica]|uniref:transketolase family protein n=1 Tax=Plastoroseomonas hellenica TaxID=2687306 RepID=UPI001BA8211C|nr:hypothetical protein [Plastoroseomonas hellenica]MBR0644710.1 transketolase [Plastoroseomonas hellenica]